MIASETRDPCNHFLGLIFDSGNIFKISWKWVSWSILDHSRLILGKHIIINEFLGLIKRDRIYIWVRKFTVVFAFLMKINCVMPAWFLKNSVNQGCSASLYLAIALPLLGHCLVWIHILAILEWIHIHSCLITNLNLECF